MSYESKDVILQVENLSVVYDGKTIIKDINLVEKDTQRAGKIQGQTIAFVGRSGRGKSTLFRALTGMIEPATGKVLVPDISKYNGEAHTIALKEVHEGDVGFVDQKYTLFRHKTVYQALHYAMRHAKLSEKEKKEKIDQHLAEWGLEKVRNQYPNELSGGQRQRTAILEQLLGTGTMMVLDEPFSGLDVGNIQNVKQAFELVNASHELNTLIFSSHDIELTVELADSIYVVGYPALDNGQRTNYGTVLQHFDLKKMGLAWKDELNGDHLDLIKTIKKTMLDS
ncbi:MAG: ABC transporter ATP-binding protein [Saprospirales bacterium]|nr:ABC transporter ATP-binding protein [Saprospirales bacterium]MBK8922413.1 ABC transporter ATP-binding protein [Saprospirales bacterium]